MTQRVLAKAREIMSRITSKLLSLAQKAKNKIDAVLAKVNTYWGTLQQKLNDMIEGTLDFLDPIIQPVYDAIGTAFNALMDLGRGFFETIGRFASIIEDGLMIIKTLVDVLQVFLTNPNIIVEEASKAVLGVDITNPLPNEYLAEPGEESQELQEIPQANLDLLGQESYADEDFEIQNAPEDVDLGDDLMDILAMLPDGRHDLGEDFPGENNGIAALKAHFGLGGETEGEEAEGAGPVGGSDRDRFVPDVNGMVGPFVDGAERVKYIGTVIKDAIVDWIKEKWPIIAGVIAGAIAGAIVVTAFFGPAAAIAVAGAILTALDVAFGIQAAGDIMLALIQYVQSAIAGDTMGAARHLARGLCLLAMEIVLGGFDYRTPDAPDGVYRAPDIPTPPKPNTPNVSKWDLISGIRNRARVRPNGDIISDAGDKISDGKFHLQGPKDNDLAGPKDLAELGVEAAEESRFRGFFIEITGLRWILYGRINPDVPLAQGRVKRQRTDRYSSVRPEYEKFKGDVPAKGRDGEFLFNDHMLSYEELLADFIAEHNPPADLIENLRIINLRKNQGAETPNNPAEFYDQIEQWENGKVLNKKTGNWVNDKEIDNFAEYDNVPGANPATPDKKLIEQKDIKDETGFFGEETFGERMDSTMENRGQAVKDRDKALEEHGKDSKEYKDAARDVIKGSEEAGELAAEAFVKQLDPNASKYVSATGGSAAGEFDQVYKLSNDRMVIVEAKGGTSTLGSRQTGTTRSQQGTPQYVQSIIDIMIPHWNPAVKATGNALQDAKQAGTLDYYLVRQPIVNGEAQDIVVKKFKI